jgi:hypothetical protein
MQSAADGARIFQEEVEEIYKMGLVHITKVQDINSIEILTHSDTHYTRGQQNKKNCDGRVWVHQKLTCKRY